MHEQSSLLAGSHLQEVSKKQNTSYYNNKNCNRYVTAGTAALSLLTYLIVVIITNSNSSSLTEEMVSQPQCFVHHSFQQSASEVIPPVFSRYSPSDRLSLAALYAKLGIYSFAYFPLYNKSITYATWNFDKRMLGEAPPPSRTWVKTNDPVEVVLYYANSLHIVQGDLDDASTGTNSEKIANIAKLEQDIRNAMVELLSKNITSTLPWERYFSYPGPNGRTWKDGTRVTWSISASDSTSPSTVRLSSSHRSTPAANPSEVLFLPMNEHNEKNMNYNFHRRLDNQIWGSNFPKSGDSVGKAFTRLIRSQVANTKKRYKKLLRLDPTKANVHWANKALLQSSNILTFHKVRKILRTMAMTIETFPEIVSGFYRPVPARVVKFVNENFNNSLDPSLPLFYGDVLCFSGSHTFGVELSQFNHCQEPIYSVSALLFIADRDDPFLTPTFFGLSEKEFRSLRGVMLIQGSKLGQHVIVSNSFGCPARHPSFKLMKKGNSMNLFDAAIDDWHKPMLTKDHGDSKFTINGTICNYDHYFGYVHDLLVLIEQESPVANAAFEDYTLDTAQGLESFTRRSNVNEVVEDILGGLC